MSARHTALLVAVGSIALVAAQDIVPLANLFHTWQYAAALLIGALVIVAYLNTARRGDDGECGRRLSIALAGALLVIATGIVSGLLGPDTQRVVARAPGTVTPVADLNAAAFFPLADADAIRRGDTSVVLRRRGKPELIIAPGAKRFVGASVLLLDRTQAAYLEARDAAHGNRLTVTQPTGSAFLSPVLLFGQSTPIMGRSLPSDIFATPAAHRTVKAILFTAADSAQLHFHRVPAGRDAVLFAVDDDTGRLVRNGIGLVPSGEQGSIGGLLLRPTVGTYPVLVVASAPSPLPLGLGIACFVAGLGWAALLRQPLAALRGRAREPSTGQS